MSAAVLAIAVICAGLLALPGQTITTKYVNDLFVFLDGAHRVLAGQVPNRDFHSALGPLSYYLPAAGVKLGGSYGAAMPIGMALTVVFLAMPGAHIVRSRLRPAVGLPLALYLLLIAAVPINLGEPVEALSFAMFYNRVGWAGLSFLLVMYVRPVAGGPGREALDVLSAAALVLFLAYTKISYGVVGLAFLALMLIDARQRRWAASALALVIACCLGIEAVWRSSASHLSDLLQAARVSGGISGLEDLGELAVRTLSGYVLFGLLAGIALWYRRQSRDLVFYGFCAGSGLMLVKQNYNNWEIVTLAAAAAVAVELACREASRPDERVPARFAVARGTKLLLLALLLPSAVHNAAALGLHTALASTRQGEPLPLPNFDRIRLAQLWGTGDYEAMKGYVGTLRDGAAALESLDRKPRHVMVLDFVSPFSAGLGLPPSQGDSTWQHWGRTLDENNFPPAAELLSDVQVVLDPKFPVEVWTAEGLRRLYGGWLAERFELARETRFWRVYVAKPVGDRDPVHSAAQGQPARTE